MTTISNFLSAGGDPIPIGSVVNFSGVPDYYDSGITQWMKSNTWISATQVTTVSVRTTCSKTPAFAALSTNSIFEFYRFPNTINPIASISGVTAIPMMLTSGTTAQALVIDSTGVASATIGQTVGYTGVGTDGGGHLITSDGTLFWSWTAASATAFGARNSTDGKTWTTATLTGLPTFASLTANAMGSNALPTSALSGTGELFGVTTTQMLVAVYCGARHLLIGQASGNMIATLSTNGLAWGGDQSVTVLGSAAIPQNGVGWWYRNGLNNFIIIGGATFASRYSNDGGITWAATTGSTLGTSGTKFKANASDPARLTMDAGGGTVHFSTNNGQSWTSRTLPITPTTLVGRGANYLACDGTSVYLSNDDGATWALISFIAGLYGSIRGVYGDANRFYVHSFANQIATTTNAITWTVRNISTAQPVTTTMQFCSALDTNNVVLSAVGVTTEIYELYTNDGGVTWKWVTRSSSATALANNAPYYRAVTTGTSVLVAGISCAITGNAGNYGNVIYGSDMTANGAAFRISTATITPTFVNSFAYARVA